LQHIRHNGVQTPALEVDKAFNEFDADAVIRALLPDLLADEPTALEVMRNPRESRAEFQRLFELLIGRWISGEHATSGVESWDCFVERVADGLQRLLDQADKSQNIAVFTSGGTITALLHLITGVSADKAFELNWQIINTSLSRLKFRGSEVVLASFNSQVHLDLLKAPELITYR
jgi:broad specificity phosphatase PhoE